MKKEAKTKKARPFEKLMLIMLNGKPVTKETIVELLGWGEPRGSTVKGPKIYNISSYVWDIKNHVYVVNCPSGERVTVKSLRDGKKVTGYQIMNVETARAYLEKRGVLKATPKATVVATVVAKVVEEVVAEAA